MTEPEKQRRGHIVDADEIDEWIKNGYSYEWMATEYHRKYGLAHTPSTFGCLHHRKGIQRNEPRREALIPWEIRRRHLWQWPAAMLRAETRRRAGEELPGHTQEHLDRWKEELQRSGQVVEYDPASEWGWHLVPARPGVDHDLIREPGASPTTNGEEPHDG